MAAKRNDTHDETRTLEIMLGLFCRDHHGRRKGLCEECSSLLKYARQRLKQCPFMPDKPTCARCTVHCYKPQMRRRVIEVMRYAGPRMTYRHPVIAIKHLIQSRLRRPKKD